MAVAIAKIVDACRVSKQDQREFCEISIFQKTTSVFAKAQNGNNNLFKETCYVRSLLLLLRKTF